MTIFQVTLGAAHTQFPQMDFQPQTMTVQNNATHVMRLGDVSVSATRGMSIAPGGSFTFILGQDYSTRISEWWVFGTAADVLDVLVV